MSAQQTLAGETTDHTRTRPNTFVICAECGDVMLRRERFEHPHETVAVDELTDDEDEEESPYEHFDAEEEVGEYFDVTISKTVEYRFRVPAYSKHEAKDLAEEWSWDASPADVYTVHTNTRSVRSITREELPDDWDPYGGERIYDALQDGEDE